MWKTLTIIVIVLLDTRDFGLLQQYYSITYNLPLIVVLNTSIRPSRANLVLAVCTWWHVSTKKQIDG